MKKDTATYHKLITAAAACFAAKGFSATSVREIAEHAGISQGAMYTYFDSKNALISAIVMEEQHAALNAQQKTTEGTFLERICSLVVSCINKVDSPTSHHLWVEIIAESSRNAQLRETFIASDIVMRQGIRQLLEKGIEAGEFNERLNPEEATILMFAVIDGLIARKTINKQFSLDKDLTSLCNIIRKIIT